MLKTELNCPKNMYSTSWRNTGFYWFHRGENHLLEISGNHYFKIRNLVHLAGNPSKKWEISYAKWRSDLPLGFHFIFRFHTYSTAWPQFWHRIARNSENVMIRVADFCTWNFFCNWNKFECPNLRTVECMKCLAFASIQFALLSFLLVRCTVLPLRNSSK